MRYLYTILFYCALPIIFLRLLWRSRGNPLYKQRWLERLGFCPHKLARCIWVHCVSVGELLCAVPLIKALKAAYPDMPLLITTMTVTGSERARAVFGDTVLHSYIPYDTPDAVKRFLHRVNPKIAIILETELWPNLFTTCQQRNIPILLANARMSAKSAAGYNQVLSITRPLLSAIHIIAAQSQDDVERFIALGMPQERIVVTGNLKFDLELPADLETNSRVLRAYLGTQRHIWIAASTHQGEEDIVLTAQRLVLAKQPDALLILVPRHPERFDTVATLVTQQDFHILRRSQESQDKIQVADQQTAQQIEDTNTNSNINNLGNISSINVYVGDTMGELLLLYSVADVAFIGGSLVPIGGHNMLEAAALHKPIIVGTQLFNFTEASQLLLAANAMVQIHNAEELAKEVLRLFNNPEEGNAMGESGYRIVEANRGALAKQLALARKILDVS